MKAPKEVASDLQGAIQGASRPIVGDLPPPKQTPLRLVHAIDVRAMCTRHCKTP